MALVAEFTVSIYFNPRSPQGERPVEDHAGNFFRISIHAPRRGSDCLGVRVAVNAPYFNPRSPQGERLFDCHLVNPPHAISIHAPRRGSDPGAIATGYGQKFQSTLPAGGATINPIFIYDLIPISIHAPRRGSDV